MPGRAKDSLENRAAGDIHPLGRNRIASKHGSRVRVCHLGSRIQPTSGASFLGDVRRRHARICGRVVSQRDDRCPLPPAATVEFNRHVRDSHSVRQ